MSVPMGTIRPMASMIPATMMLDTNAANASSKASEPNRTPLAIIWYVKRPVPTITITTRAITAAARAARLMLFAAVLIALNALLSPPASLTACTASTMPFTANKTETLCRRISTACCVVMGAATKSVTATAVKTRAPTVTIP